MLSIMLFVTMLMLAVPCTALVVPPAAPEMFFSPANWARNATTAISVNAGSYLKISYTNMSANAPPVLLLQPTDPSQGTHYMNILYSIDDWEWVELPVLSNTTRLQLAPSSRAHVGSDVTHNLTVMIYNSMQSFNRWTAPTAPHGAAIVIVGLELDGGATPLPRADLAPKRCVFYGDSITEGVASQCQAAADCTAHGDLCSNSATKTWGQ